MNKAEILSFAVVLICAVSTGLLIITAFIVGNALVVGHASPRRIAYWFTVALLALGVLLTAPSMTPQSSLLLLMVACVLYRMRRRLVWEAEHPEGRKGRASP